MLRGWGSISLTQQMHPITAPSCTVGGDGDREGLGPDLTRRMTPFFVAVAEFIHQ